MAFSADSEVEWLICLFSVNAIFFGVHGDSFLSIVIYSFSVIYCCFSTCFIVLLQYISPRITWTASIKAAYKLNKWIKKTKKKQANSLSKNGKKNIKNFKMLNSLIVLERHPVHTIFILFSARICTISYFFFKGLVDLTPFINTHTHK